MRERKTFPCSYSTVHKNKPHLRSFVTVNRGIMKYKTTQFSPESSHIKVLNTHKYHSACYTFAYPGAVSGGGLC